MEYRPLVSFGSEYRPLFIWFSLLDVECYAVPDLLMLAQTSSRRYNVWDDHTLTAVDPLVV